MATERIEYRTLLEEIGRGDILQDGEVIGSADYQLILKCKVHIFPDQELSGQKSGELRLWGLVNADATLMLMADTAFALRLEDGRRTMPFLVSGAESRTNSITVEPNPGHATGFSEIDSKA